MKNDGIMLLEVLLAVAVLSAGILAVFGAFSRSTANLRLSRDRLSASLLVENRVCDLELTGKVEESSRMDDDLPDMKWNVHTAALSPTDFERTKVSLSWGHGNKRDELTMSFDKAK